MMSHVSSDIANKIHILAGKIVSVELKLADHKAPSPVVIRVAVINIHLTVCFSLSKIERITL